MQSRVLSFAALLFVGCGGATPQEQAPVPLVEIARDDKAPPIETGVSDGEGDDRVAPVRAVETAGVCLEKMREGRGLPSGAVTNEAGQLYAEALGDERAERLDHARRGYLSLIQRNPQSPLVPLTYFAFAELFFREGQSDPMKLALAEQAYKEVMKYPAPENTAMAFTLFRLGELFGKSGKGPEALNMLSKFMTLAETQPKAQCAESLADSGRKLMASVYAEAGQPNKAFLFFVRSTGGDRALSKTNAFEMLANLCDIYIRQQKPESAAAALVAVSDEQAPGGFCMREERILAQISASISASTRDELVRMHAGRCARP